MYIELIKYHWSFKKSCHADFHESIPFKWIKTMKLSAQVFDLRDDLINQLFLPLILLFLCLSQFNSHDYFFQNIVIMVVLKMISFPIVKLLFQFEVYSKRFRLYLVQVRQKIFTEVLVILIKSLQYHQARDNDEDISLNVLNHIPEFMMFFCYTLYRT